MTITITIPLTLTSPNKKEHWAVSYKRNKKHKQCIKFLLNHHYDAIKNSSGPIYSKVTLIRHGKKLFDSDNLASAFKHIRDCVADFLFPGLPPGQADSDERIEWHYDQFKGTEALIQIKFDNPKSVQCD